MHLYFLRHGQAGHNFPTDFERELTDEGRHAAKNVGRFCAEMNIHFTHAFVSPLVRAKQTARAVLQKLPELTPVETDYLKPETETARLLELLRPFSIDSRILLVTHEPFVSDCISSLISGTDAAHVVMKPATIACVETTGAPVRGNGKLRWLLTPQIIDQLI